jgi:hypothetical protein
MDKTLEKTELEAAPVAPPMAGTYNGADNYPKCDRGVKFLFSLQAGQSYDAMATLEKTPDPTFVLKIRAAGFPPAGAMYRQVLPNEPPSNFDHHTQVEDADYPLNAAVPVKVTVAQSGEIVVERS